MLSTYQKWALDVPDDFQFSIKLSREITHVKKLAFDSSNTIRFIQKAEGLGDKKGCLLIQFPGAITLDYYNEVEQILQEIDAESKPDFQWRKAIEFRDPSWHTGETYELLDYYRAVSVLHDFKKAKLSDIFGKQEFVYLRFHGPKGDYRGSYDDGLLKSKAVQIKRWLNEGMDVYAYFNNTIGNAFENAHSFKKMVKPR
jgi:uncharacterized protein YecE (DUF72 family)